MDFKRLFFFMVLFLTILYCENSDLESQVSAIQPKPKFISNAERGKILSPRPSQTISTSDYTFYFDARSFSNATLLIFSSEVSASQLTSGPGATCVGGASSLAGHSWNGSSIFLGSSTGTTQLYACNANDPVNFLSTTTKVTNLPAGTYYLLLLGYDGNVLLSHSSSLSKFTTL